MHSTFNELSLVIGVGVLISLGLRLIRQPLTIAYILTGVLVGPAVFNLIHSKDVIEVFANFGIALLLLIVGLGLNPRIIKEVGKIAGVIAVTKVFLATLVGFGLAKAFGYDTTTALYIGVSLSFSSTIIILKILTDKKEQSRLYGKISIGYLLVEDVLATFVLIIASANSNGGISVSSFATLVFKGMVLVGGLILIKQLFLNHLNSIIAKSQEFLFLFAIGWGLCVAAIFGKAGFSVETGALLAGVTLASLPYAQEVSSRLKPLRDFFIVLFFISLGSHLQVGDIRAVLPHALILSAFVLIGNPIIVMTTMGLSGYTKKTSFKAGLTGAQISEFSLILLLLAVSQGQIPQQAASLVTVVAFITIAVSTYTNTYADKLYVYFEKYLHLFERKKVRSDRDTSHHYELVLIGYNKGGHEFVKVFQQLKKKYVVIDYDPAIIDTLEQKNIEYIYGDVTDPELLEEVNLDRAKLIVSTITDFATNASLMAWLDKEDPKAVFICTADSLEEAAELYSKGAAYVMLPHLIGSEKIGSFIKRSGLKKSEFKIYREKHLAYLQSHYELDLDQTTAN